MSYKLKKRRTIKKKKIRGGAITQADIDEFFEELKKPLKGGYYAHSGVLSNKFFELDPDAGRHQMRIKDEYHPIVRDGYNHQKLHTALYTACRFGTTEMIRMVLKVPGVNVNRGNGRDNSTPAIGVCYGPSGESKISLSRVLDVFKMLDDYSKENNPRLDLTLANDGGETVWTTLHYKAVAGNLLLG